MKIYSFLFGSKSGHGTEKIDYSFSRTFRKWKFSLPNGVEYITRCGGAEQADKAASILAGAFKRGGKVDNLARAGIERLTSVKSDREMNSCGLFT